MYNLSYENSGKVIYFSRFPLHHLFSLLLSYVIEVLISVKRKIRHPRWNAECLLRTKNTYTLFPNIPSVFLTKI